MKLLLSAPLTSADSAAFAQHKTLVSLLTEVRGEEHLELQSRKGLSDEALFDAFYKTEYGVEPKAELKTLFLETMSELLER